jgi:protease-4
MLVTLVAGFSLPVLACYGLILTGAVALQILSLGASRPDLSAARGGFGPAVGVVRVEGVITSDDAATAGLGTASAETVVQNLRAADEDPDVKAILLVVNSPGGGVTASDLIYHELKQVEKPVVVLMGDLAASGGYYISMAADWIVANPNTLTGSIGVISEFPNASGLLEKAGVEFVVITSGPRKDFGSPYREMTDAERAYWQVIVDESYAGFVKIVAEGRKMSEDQVRALADGAVFTGRQALEKGLVDELGYREDALAKAAELGGLTGEPRVIEFDTRPRLIDLFTRISQRGGLLPSWAEVASLIGYPRLSARWVGP